MIKRLKDIDGQPPKKTVLIIEQKDIICQVINCDISNVLELIVCIKKDRYNLG